jgi:hypothetical protein
MAGRTRKIQINLTLNYITFRQRMTKTKALGHAEGSCWCAGDELVAGQFHEIVDWLRALDADEFGRSAFVRSAAAFPAPQARSQT